jgi:hypothetical protein
MQLADGKDNESRPVVELTESALGVLCRRVRGVGIFAPARWRAWDLGEIIGFWVGRPRLFPPQFWMFETNSRPTRPISRVGWCSACAMAIGFTFASSDGWTLLRTLSLRFVRVESESSMIQRSHKRPRLNFEAQHLLGFKEVGD